MKSKFYLGLIGALALTACNSTDEPTPGQEGNEQTHFLSINVVATPVTRAAGVQTVGDPNAMYEEGYGNENDVKSVRFYFFDETGAAAKVKSDGTNFFTWTTPEGNTPDMPNVERVLNAVVVIKTPAGDKLPQQIVAVVNPNANSLGEGNLSLDDLRTLTADYAKTCKLTETGTFQMINSVYAEDSKAIVANAVSAEKYCNTEDEAKANPIAIYVERAVAKVRVKFSQDAKPNESGYIALKDKAGKELKVTVDGAEKQVYLKVGNWNITANTTTGYLSKHIDTSWANNLMGTNPWNWADYHRSFWAINPDGVKQEYFSYNDMKNNGKGYEGNLENSLYTNENAPQAADLNAADVEGEKIAPFTKIVLTGQLGTLDGSDFKPLDLIKYAGMEYVNEADIKAFMLKSFAANGNVYAKTTIEGETETKYTAISADDVEFKTALAANAEGVTASENTNGRYNVYLQLTEDAAKKAWVAGNTPSAKSLTTKEVNAKLVSILGKAQYYKSGLTYYYLPIRHLGEANHVGYYGVVRNHIYDCTISGITGYGTAVYDPEEVIYPERPRNDETYIAAQINILSWRVVANEYKFEW